MKQCVCVIIRYNILYYTYINTIVIRNSFIILSQTYRNQNLINLINVKINYHAIMLGQSVNYTQHNSGVIVIIDSRCLQIYFVRYNRSLRKMVQGKRKITLGSVSI